MYFPFINVGYPLMGTTSKKGILGRMKDFHYVATYGTLSAFSGKGSHAVCLAQLFELVNQTNVHETQNT